MEFSSQNLSDITQIKNNYSHVENGIHVRNYKISNNKVELTVDYDELSKFKIKDSQRKSVFMQSLLPGLGMLNEGAPIEGLQSFLLNGAFVAVPIILLKQNLFLGAFVQHLFATTHYRRSA